MPDTLEILDIFHNGNHLYQIPEIILMSHTNLQTLRAIDARISNITKPIYCRYDPLIQEIDVTNNSINFIHQDVFTKCDWTSILKLKMSGNMLGNLLKTQGSEPFTRPLSRLLVRILHAYLAPKTNSLDAILNVTFSFLKATVYYRDI